MEVRAMEWALPLVFVLVVLVFVVPLALLLAAVALLGFVGHFGPGWPVISRATFNCPFSKRRASVEFLTPSGSEKTTDVLSCSVFSEPYQVRCQKGCLELATAGWSPPLTVPRYALLADGVALRPVSRSKGAGVTSPSAN
jgi:hypothetical protein